MFTLNDLFTVLDKDALIRIYYEYISPKTCMIESRLGNITMDMIGTYLQYYVWSINVDNDYIDVVIRRDCV
jgi:hypothetical protein